MRADEREERLRRQWESAASGWADWERTVAAWMEPATEVMLSMGGVSSGARVFDLGCGAGSQTLRAARKVGPRGHVVANDIAEAMLDRVREKARACGRTNVTTSVGAAEDIDVAPGSFDASICHLALMLFHGPAKALAAVRRALRPGGRVAVVVFTTPRANPFMARPMEILLRHAGEPRPEPGAPGIFALGAPGVLQRLLTDAGFVDVEQSTVAVPLRMDTAERALTMMQDAFGAYRAVLSESSEEVRAAAWAEVGAFLETFRTEAGFVAPAEVLVAAAARPGSAGDSQG